LVTRFLSEDGVVEVQDFMPVGPAYQESSRAVIRRVLAVRGAMELRTEVRPRFSYGRHAAVVEFEDEGLVLVGDELRLRLRASVELEPGEGQATATFSLDEGDAVAFVMEFDGGSGAGVMPVDVDEALASFDATVAFWRGLAGAGHLSRPLARDGHAIRADLEAADSPPDRRGPRGADCRPARAHRGERNWDYRYVWSRDAAFSAYALLRLGYREEAHAFVGWLTNRLRDADGSGSSGPLAVLYDLDGNREVPEETLQHLEGYRGSAPVRIGNEAGRQRQLDIYGEVIDSVYLYNKYGAPISAATWDDLSEILEWICENWDQPDEGIWETRGGQHHNTYSRLMCWVAVERMVRMSRQRGLPGDLVRWMGVRDAIYRQIMDRGFSQKRQAFVQRYGSEALDASLLLMPMVKFISATDPRFLSTLDAIEEDLVSDSLVHRYARELSPDGLDGDEGTFSICSFWYVEALTRAGRRDQARVALEKMFTYANHLGLYAEQIGHTGEHLGNFPQAFTHLALISAAYNLDRALDVQ
jgi:GH15 family glucan-1,4-alpha-glucosidase